MLGIDVSKASLTTTFLVARDQRPLWEMTVPNTPAGIARLLARTAPDCPWVVEPTGVYSQAVVTHAHAAGRQVLLAQPKRAKDFLASLAPREDRSGGQLWLGALWSGGRFTAVSDQE